MKKQLYKAALVAAFGLASVTGAQAANNDLLIGFNDAAGPGSAQNDYVLDLGAATLFTTTSTHTFSIDNPSFQSAFGTDLNALNNVAVGAGEGLGGVGGQVMATHATMPGVNTGIQLINAASAISGTTLGVYSSGAGSPTDPWSSSVASSPTASAAGSFSSSLLFNVLSSLSSGQATLTLWENTIGGTSRSPTAGGWIELGTLAIDANNGVDTIIYNGSNVSVPEPSTYGLFAGAGLLVIALRRQLSSKNA